MAGIKALYTSRQVIRRYGWAFAFLSGGRGRKTEHWDWVDGWNWNCDWDRDYITLLGRDHRGKSGIGKGKGRDYIVCLCDGFDILTPN